MAVLLRQETEDLYDLWVDQRIADVDLESYEFADALRRARVHKRDDIFVEDMTGYRTRWRGRR